MLLEVGGHGRVAAQSLTRALQASVALHDPGAAAGVFAQHAAAAGRRRDSAVGYRGAHRQNFGLLAPRGEVGVVALKHAADVVQEVVEELGDALVTWKYRHEKQTVRTLLPMATQQRAFLLYVSGTTSLMSCVLITPSLHPVTSLKPPHSGSLEKMPQVS